MALSLPSSSFVLESADPNGPKKVLEVLRIEHIGDGQRLELDVLDNAYDPNDLNTLISTGGQVEVNYDVATAYPFFGVVAPS